jgi:hypothetical protein
MKGEIWMEYRIQLVRVSVKRVENTRSRQYASMCLIIRIRLTNQQNRQAYARRNRIYVRSDAPVGTRHMLDLTANRESA